MDDEAAATRRRPRPAWGAAISALGALVLAIGVGLLPHLLDNGLTATGVIALVLAASGLALTVLGARWVLAGRRRAVGVGGGIAIGVSAAILVWLLAPPIAATNVPRSDITTTPEDHGLAAEDVTMTTADGVDLAGWFVPARSPAAVVLLHGAGSTRSNVLDQAEVLHRHGYGVLMVDARGHGDSEGRAMDFGWYGDLDVAAAVDHLAGRDDVDPSRIGVVGMSMGGEEAIGAAAAVPAISAVVAEGATGRTADDKAWLSDVYGWRGALQEQFEHLQYGVTDLLTDASPPTSLRDAVARADRTPFLLIAAGKVTDETAAADHIASGAPERVMTWTVDGAGHTGGLDTVPAQWEARVVGFLDEHLAASP